MKNKKSLLVFVLVALVLVLGVGYAVISQVTLTVTGSAQAAETDLKVAITAASPAQNVNDSTQTHYGTVSSPADLTATFTVKGLSQATTSRTITYTVTNSDSVAAKVYKKAISGTNEYFTATTNIETEQDAITIQPNSTGTFTVTVTMSKAPIASGDSTLNNITVELNAVPVAAS